MAEHIIRNKFDRESVRLFFKKPSRTKQEFIDECDINSIMARYEKTGTIAHHANGQPRYGDFTNATDYLTASNQVLEAQATFDALPASVRDRMENNPANLITFMDDEENYDEAVELGLIIPKEPEATPTPAPTPPEPAPEPPPAE